LQPLGPMLNFVSQSLHINWNLENHHFLW
jgi:hypothetical protein